MARTRAASIAVVVALAAVALLDRPIRANPWNGKVVLQAFWWDAWTERHPQDRYTYLAKLAPRLRDLGFDGIWIPSPLKGNAGTNSMGYDPFDHYDLGDKDQKGTVATRFGTKDSLLRLVAVAQKRRAHGQHQRTGEADGSTRSCWNSRQAQEGYYQLCARLAGSGPPVRGYVKVEYQGPRTSDRF